MKDYLRLMELKLLFGTLMCSSYYTILLNLGLNHIHLYGKNTFNGVYFTSLHYLAMYLEVGQVDTCWWWKPLWKLKKCQ